MSSQCSTYVVDDTGRIDPSSAAYLSSRGSHTHTLHARPARRKKRCARARGEKALRSARGASLQAVSR